MANTPSKQQIEKALLTGDALPAGDYAVDFLGEVKVRALNADDKAAVSDDPRAGAPAPATGTEKAAGA